MYLVFKFKFMEIKGWQRKERHDADKETIQTHTPVHFFFYLRRFWLSDEFALWQVAQMQ